MSGRTFIRPSAFIAQRFIPAGCARGRVPAGRGRRAPWPGLAAYLRGIAIAVAPVAAVVPITTLPRQLATIHAGSNQAVGATSPRRVPEASGPEHSAHDQVDPAPPRSEPRSVWIGAHLLFGRQSQSASDSFVAILGRSSGLVWGAGVELTFGSGLFARADISFFGTQGQRVELVDGDIVPLGIPVSISLNPIEFSGGFRWPALALGGRWDVKLVPFVAAGAGVLRFREQTDEQHPEESAHEAHSSAHVLVGLDVPLGEQMAFGVELARRWVPDGLGTGGVSRALGDTDLGGSTVRVRIRLSF
jgi:hypothetical protein